MKKIRFVCWDKSSRYLTDLVTCLQKSRSESVLVCGKNSTWSFHWNLEYELIIINSYLNTNVHLWCEITTIRKHHMHRMVTHQIFNGRLVAVVKVNLLQKCTSHPQKILSSTVLFLLLLLLLLPEQWTSSQHPIQWCHLSHSAGVSSDNTQPDTVCKYCVWIHLLYVNALITCIHTYVPVFFFFFSSLRYAHFLSQILISAICCPVTWMTERYPWLHRLLETHTVQLLTFFVLFSSHTAPAS